MEDIRTNFPRILFSAKMQLPRIRSREHSDAIGSIITQLLPDSIHRDQINVSVFKPEWIVVVVKKRAGMSAVPIGQYFLSPFSAPSLKVKTTDEVILPLVPEVKLNVESKPEPQTDNHKELGMKLFLSTSCKCLFPYVGFLHIDQLPVPKGLVFEFIAKQNSCAVKKRETTRTKT